MPTVVCSHLDGHAREADSYDRNVDSQIPLLKKPIPEPAAASKRIALLVQDWWLWEIVSALTAATAIAVIVTVLVAFDQSSLPDWPSAFTVRSIYVPDSDALLKDSVDKLGHLLLRRNREAFYHVISWSLDLAIEMVVVPPA